ncbi:MAG TPA: aminodeoxychorismate lyase [Pseudomonadales bacterium]|nr:aminodeoxychorismate lyase [Pseudomonadales bacterium]
MQAAAAIPTSWERAIASGDGFFETILVVDGAASLWAFHRTRLTESAKRLQIHCDIAALEKDFLACAMQHNNAVIKIVIARAGGQRGYRAQTAQDVTVSIKAYPAPQFSKQQLTQGVRLHVCRQKLAVNTALAGIKHLNRLEQVLAADERDALLYDEGLMLDESGCVIEGVSSNIFILRNNTLLTPRLDHCGVAGVMRAAVMQQFSAQIALPVQETRLTLNDCLSADGMFICNSVIGIVPVQSIGVSQIPVHREVTTQCWQVLSSLGYARLYV